MAACYFTMNQRNCIDLTKKDGECLSLGISELFYDFDGNFFLNAKPRQESHLLQALKQLQNNCGVDVHEFMAEYDDIIKQMEMDSPGLRIRHLYDVGAAGRVSMCRIPPCMKLVKVYLFMLRLVNEQQMNVRYSLMYHVNHSGNCFYLVVLSLLFASKHWEGKISRSFDSRALRVLAADYLHDRVIEPVAGIGGDGSTNYLDLFFNTTNSFQAGKGLRLVHYHEMVHQGGQDGTPSIPIFWYIVPIVLSEKFGIHLKIVMSSANMPDTECGIVDYELELRLGLHEGVVYGLLPNAYLC